MAVYAILMVFAAIDGVLAAIIEHLFGPAAMVAFFGAWAALGVIIAAPVIVEAGRPGKLDDLLKYLLCAITAGPFMLTGMLDFYGRE